MSPSALANARHKRIYQIRIIRAAGLSHSRPQPPGINFPLTFFNALVYYLPGKTS